MTEATPPAPPEEDESRRAIEFVALKIDELVLATPTGPRRNKLCDARNLILSLLTEGAKTDTMH